MRSTDIGINRLAARIANQSELELPANTAGTMVGRIRSQFAHRGFVSVSDVATACNVSCRTVLAWREAGLIEGINIGSGEKAYYRIFAPSVVTFFEKRSQQL
jgi:hypothetical protein